MNAVRNRLSRRLISVALGVGLVLSAAKFVAYYRTGSNAILTDALESIVNILAGGFALYSVVLAAQPRDANHPYGHGKIEYVAAGFEGGLVALAGFAMLGKSAVALFDPMPIKEVDLGLMLVLVAGLGNLAMGLLLHQAGKRHNSLVLTAEGRHLLMDVVTTVGVWLGLLLVRATELPWLDPAIALALSAFILWQGARLLRSAVAGLMDEADFKLLETITLALVRHRKPNWVDVHHLRAQQFGDTIHVDCHLTLPWYYDLPKVRAEVKALERLLNDEMPAPVEASICTDPCVPESCAICSLDACPARQGACIEHLAWTPARLMRNHKHAHEGPAASAKGA